jgi:dUTP pyrophosphatase
MEKIEINYTGKESRAPSYQSPGSAGADIFALLDNPVTLKPLHRILIPTGMSIALPMGYEAQIRPRSGLAYKQGLTVLNSPGTIDSDYRGEIKILLINLGNEDVIINSGDRIAQMIIAPYKQADFILKDSLDKTERGQGGFGSTGI